MARTILFLCTGNYYRSRFAEELFNHLARQKRLDWVADSRALALERGACNVGPISPFAKQALAALGIGLTEPIRHPVALRTAELHDASRVIALKEAEHRPYLTERHPGWCDRVEYWHIHDLDMATPDQALAGIARQVELLIEQLQSDSQQTTLSKGQK